MTGIRISALTFFIISHLCLVSMFVFENELQNVDFPYFFIIWGIGILNAGLNIYYGVDRESCKSDFTVRSFGFAV